MDGVGQFGSNSSLVVTGCGNIDSWRIFDTLVGLEMTNFTVSAWVYRSLTLGEAPILWSNGGFYFGFRSSASSQSVLFSS